MDITTTIQGLPLVAHRVVRLPLVLGIGAWNLWLFFPKDLLSR